MKTNDHFDITFLGSGSAFYVGSRLGENWQSNVLITSPSGRRGRRRCVYLAFACRLYRRPGVADSVITAAVARCMLSLCERETIVDLDLRHFHAGVACRLGSCVMVERLPSRNRVSNRCSIRVADFRNPVLEIPQVFVVLDRRHFNLITAVVFDFRFHRFPQ